MWQKTTMTVEIIKVIVWPLQLFISCIPVRDFWYYTMWNLNASSGRGAQWSGGKLRDDYATSQADMETCCCLDPAPTSEGDRIWVWCSGFAGAVLWTAFFFFGGSLNMDIPVVIGEKEKWNEVMGELLKCCKESVCWGKRKLFWMQL